MPISTICLPDVNVWLALAYDKHEHNPSAINWFNQVRETVAFCRVTQMGFLRLISNRKVMRSDVRSAHQAWATYDLLYHDSQVTYLAEPDGLEETWRAMQKQENPPHSWTDTYLLAFAKTRHLTLVTFDQALRTAADVAVKILL